MRALVIPLLFISLFSQAQKDAYDFWIGEWELSWTDKENNTVKGYNKIERVLSGQIIQENFSTLEKIDSLRFVGKSWTAYNPVSKTWKQTWVDNSGAYLDFTGFIEGDKKGFKRSFLNPKGKKIYQRMIFFRIEDDSFIWEWQNSKDEKDWKLLWKIHYRKIQN